MQQRSHRQHLIFPTVGGQNLAPVPHATLVTFLDISETEPAPHPLYHIILENNTSMVGESSQDLMMATNLDRHASTLCNIICGGRRGGMGGDTLDKMRGGMAGAKWCKVLSIHRPGFGVSGHMLIPHNGIRVLDYENIY